MSDLTAWYRTRMAGWSTKAVIAVALLAVLLVAAMPVALLAGVILMLLGHVVGGLALFGGSVLAAVAAITIAGMGGVRQLRKLAGQLRTQYRVVQLGQGDYHYE